MKMYQNQIHDPFQYRRFVYAFIVVWASILYSACKTDNGSNTLSVEMLDRIEAVMFQQQESLDSLLGEVDTTNIAPKELARVRTIRGLFHYENGEYGKSISELEKAETYFISQGDHYHRNINKLIMAFTFEYLKLDNNAVNLYVECEDYFNANHLNQFKFYATLGLLRMSKHLQLDDKGLIDRLKKAAEQLNDPNFFGLLYSTIGGIEKNDSLSIIFYEQAKSYFNSIHRWSRVYAIDLNTLFMKIKKDPSENTQLYYDNFNKIEYLYTPTTRQRMRYSYAQAYLYAKRGKDLQSIEAANQVLKEATALNVARVETDCVQLLAYLYKRTGDFKNAHSMLERHNKMKEAELKALQQNRLLALGAHYRYAEMEREKLDLKVQVQQSYFITGALILIFIIVFTVVWFSLKESKYKQEILKLKNIEIKDQISNLIRSLDNQKNKNEKLILQVEELKVQYNYILISEFLQAVVQKQIKTWMEYEAYFLKLRPGWVRKLKQAVPELTVTDLKYCMCLYFNLNNYTIAGLCDTGVEAVKSAKKRIRDKFSLNDSKEIYLFLKSFD